MDTLKIESPFLTTLVSRIITKQLTKKLGVKGKLDVESVQVEKDENDYILDLKVKGRIAGTSIVDLVKDLL